MSYLTPGGKSLGQLIHLLADDVSQRRERSRQGERNVKQEGRRFAFEAPFEVVQDWAPSSDFCHIFEADDRLLSGRALTMSFLEVFDIGQPTTCDKRDRQLGALGRRLPSDRPGWKIRFCSRTTFAMSARHEVELGHADRDPGPAAWCSSGHRRPRHPRHRAVV